MFSDAVDRDPWRRSQACTRDPDRAPPNVLCEKGEVSSEAGHGATPLDGPRDDALAQGDGGRAVVGALIVPAGKPGKRAQGAGVIGAEQALVVGGDLLGQHHLVVAPAHLAVAIG